MEQQAYDLRKADHILRRYQIFLFDATRSIARINPPHASFSIVPGNEMVIPRVACNLATVFRHGKQPRFTAGTAEMSKNFGVLASIRKREGFSIAPIANRAGNPYHVL